MIKVIRMWVGLLIGATACGGPAGQAEPESAPEAQALATLQWHEEMITFYDTSAPGEEPSVIISRTGPLVGGDAYTAFQGQAQGVTVTAADLWNALSLEPVPEVLLEEHAAIVRREGRTPEFLPFDESLAHATLPTERLSGVAYDTSLNINTLFNLSGHTGCWAGVKVQNAHISTANFGAFVCSSHSPAADQVNDFVRVGSISFPGCPLRLSDKSPERVGFLNPDFGHDLTTQLCFQSGSWRCNGPVTIHAGFYSASDQVATSVNHEFGQSAQVPANTSPLDIQFGAARLEPTGVPQFHSVTCGTF